MRHKHILVPVAVAGLLGLWGCTNIPSRVHESGVRIELATTDAGAIRTAGFWTDNDGLSLRGELSPPRSRHARTEHIDIAITKPDESTTVCAIALLSVDSRHGGSVFAHRFAALPPRDSLIQLRRHDSAPHSDCAGEK